LARGFSTGGLSSLTSIAFCTSFWAETTQELMPTSGYDDEPDRGFRWPALLDRGRGGLQYATRFCTT